MLPLGIFQLKTNRLFLYWNERYRYRNDEDINEVAEFEEDTSVSDVILHYDRPQIGGSKYRDGRG